MEQICAGSIFEGGNASETNMDGSAMIAVESVGILRDSKLSAMTARLTATQA